MEYDVNRENYLQESKTAWEEFSLPFRNQFLTDSSNDYWFKIPVEQFSIEKRTELQTSISQRKLYLLKLIKEGAMINAFCSLPNSSNDLTNCLLFKLINKDIKLISIENVCEDCFGVGYIENAGKSCNRCSGKGFEYSKTSEYINWKTAFFRPADSETSGVLRLPESSLQKAMVLLQAE